MIIHKLLICITAAIPLGFNLSLIVMPYISLHCASSDKRWANSFGKKRTRLHTRCIIHVTMFLCSTKSMHLLMCSLGEVWIEEGWRPDGTAGSGYLLKLRICPYSQSRWCLWQVDGARAGKAEAQDGKGELGWTWPITTPLSLGFRWTLGAMESMGQRDSRRVQLHRGHRAVAPSQYKIDLQSLLHKFLKCHRLLCSPLSANMVSSIIARSLVESP